MALAEVGPALTKEKLARPETSSDIEKYLEDTAHIEGNAASDGSEGEHDASIPTLEEIQTLRRLPAPVPWRAYAVATCELGERFSYYGATNAFTNYIQQPRPSYSVGGRTGANRTSGGITGALDKKQRAAFGITTFNSFWVYCTPLLGAYLADSYWGRYNTIVIALFIATAGYVGSDLFS